MEGSVGSDRKNAAERILAQTPAFYGRATAPAARRARFRREPEDLGFELTERDREIVWHVARHRYLRSEHVRAVFGCRSVLYRLQGLYHHGYLERVRVG